MIMVQTVSHPELPDSEKLPTNLIWNIRLFLWWVESTSRLKTIKVYHHFKLIFIRFLFSFSIISVCRGQRCTVSVGDVSIIFEKDFDIFRDDRFYPISNIPTISAEYGHCIDWIYCGFWNQLQSSAAIQRYITRHQNFQTETLFVKLKIR